MHLTCDYQINNGDYTTMTPLQRLAVNCIASTIRQFKFDNKPFVTI